MSDKHCGSCAHWKQLPRDPHNLSAPAQGQCRCGPPAPLMVPTPQGVAVAVAYPTTPAEFPACGRHELPVAG